jgi:DNA-binding LacI/PurR family transcriptional regulator
VPGHKGTAKRVTIRDIAERAGVSKGAVSYALNGRSGLSAETRARILGIAEELGWYPNRAARALSAARAHACGLVLARPAATLAAEPFFMEFISGVESLLAAQSVALTIQVVDTPEQEMVVHRRWWAERRVDGVFVVDLRIDDPRVAELAGLGLPAVVVGGPPEGHLLPAVWNDEVAAVEEVVRYLSALGHTRIGRVAGVDSFAHTKLRTEAFTRIADELSIESTVVANDYTAESSARATRRLLSESEPPTAIVYDNSILGVTGLGVAHQMGFSVPDDVSIVAWDDSLICQVVHPPLTAVTRDITAYGAAASKRLLEAIDGSATGDVEVPPGVLTPRGSTAPPRRAEPRGPRR